MPELTECRVCKKEMASSAKECPHCGDPNPDYRERPDPWGCVGAGVVVVAAGLILLMLGPPCGPGGF